MKGKPKSQTTQNTYRFQTFSERIASININVVRKIAIQPVVPEEGDTFLAEGLTKWSELNFTDDFDAFKRDLPDVVTLKQLVLNETEVIELIAKHLENEKSLALQPILELVIAVAKDLQIDFYPYYSKFFTIILKLVKTKDVDIIEWSFTTLSYLFKFLWRYMIKDIEEVFTLYVPFLTKNQPEHIRNFAAESFAFLIRKVPDKEALLDFIFKQLENNSENSIGFGQLLFEVVKGVQQQFHSCIEVILPLILKKLGLGNGNRTTLSWDLVFDCQTQMADSMAHYSCRNFMHPIWNIFSKFITQLVSEDENAENFVDSQEHLSMVLNLWKMFIIHENGVLITEVKHLAEVLEMLLSRSKYTTNCADTILELIAFWLMNLSSKLEVCDITRLIGMVFNSLFPYNSKFTFVKFMFSYGMFEKDVLPPLVNYCQKCINDETQGDVLLLFTQIILNFRPVPNNGDDFKAWQRYNFDFRKASNITEKLKQFLNGDVEDIYADLPMLLSVLILLPHIKPLEFICVNTKLTILRNNIFTLANSDIPFIFNQLVTCQILLGKNSDEFLESFDGSSLLQLLTACPKNKFILRTLDVVLNYAKIHKKKACFGKFKIEILFPQLKPNLKSSHHEVRLLTLRILSSFDLKLPRVATENFQQMNVFSICLAAEQINPTISTYRERIKFLQKLDWELVRPNIPEGNYDEVPLLYLVGSLFVNFKLLWNPICKLIETYARGMKSELFWENFIPILEDDANVIVSESQLISQGAETEDTQVQLLNSLDSVYKSFLAEKNDRPDYINHRELLWSVMSSIIDVAEPRNRAIVPLFFKFLQEEYYKADVSVAPTQDLSKTKVITEVDNEMELDELEITEQSLNETEFDIYNDEIEIDEKNDKNDDHDNDVSMEDDEEEQASNKLAKKVFTPRKKKTKNSTKGNVMKTLCSYLSVIAKFHNPKAVYCEQELRDIMETFLTHRNSKIQKYALDFIISYRENSINKYQEKLYSLLSDKTVKGVLTKFNIDVECKVVEEGDREKVLPVVLRILFGRMNASIGKNTSGKKNSTKRRAIVMRFLAGAQESELKMFLDLAFEPFLKYTNVEVKEIVSNIVSSINPAAVLPLKKIQWALNLLSIAFSKIGNLMANHLPWLLKLILSMLAIVNQLLERRNEVHPKFINPLRSLRSLALMELVKFFELFDNYPFSTIEIEAIFEAAIWPQLERLHYESIYTPTPLLRLMQVWSTNPRYFALLAKYNVNDKSFSPLSKLMELFTSEQTRSVVLRYILDMLESILTLADYNAEEGKEGEGSLIEVSNTYEVDRNKFTNGKEPPNFGTLILLPHINPIFARLKIIVKKLSSKKTRTVPEAVLTILLRASEHLTDTQQCNELANLLFPFLVNKGKNPENVEVTILKTIGMISKYVTEPKRFVKTIAQLFGSLTKRASRVQLCELMKIVGKRCTEYELPSLVIIKLNAWDTRRVEEPNYMERLDGFQSATEKIPEMIENNMDFALLTIFNSFYMIRNCGDLALRESSTHFLCQFSAHFHSAKGKKKDACMSLLHNAFLPEIKSGLKSKSEAVRHEFIIILTSVLRSSSDVPKIKDLCSLFSDDPEVDFFENIRHIQIHRRARALTRLSKCDQLALFQEDILMQYLMPIATSFLFCEDYVKHPFLIDAAIECVGSICKALSWYKYETILKHYLFLLPKNGDYQKTVVRLIVVILEAFHFDLSMSLGVACNLRQPPLKAAKKKNRKTDEEIKENIEKDKEDLEMQMDIDDEEKMEDDEEIPLKQPKTSKEISFATRIHNQVIKGILPQLSKCLTKKTRSDSQHKLVKNHYVEDEEILRIPIALAIVKLLQNLPKGTLEQHLGGLFLKLCVFLKSRALAIRTTTRDVLVKIMDSIGPRYFPYLLKQMKQTMTKGYQVHVMIFTVHAVLFNLMDRLTVGDLDDCLKSLLNVCNNELFGDISEEKEVEEIVKNLKEARGCKSYNLYEIMAKFVSESHLVGLVQPLKEVLLTTHKHQVVNKAKECLHSVVLGLSENKELDAKTFLVFSHGLINENIPTLNGIKKKTTPKLPPHLQRPDSYLLPEEPKRTGGVAKTSIKTNSHILIEFGLQLVYFYLKRGKLISTKVEHMQMIDPFVPHLIECLSSMHVKIVATSLRCILLLLKFPIPSLKTHIKRLSVALFVILNKYGSTGAAQGENFEMVNLCFKVIGVLVREIEYYNITKDHLKVLLTYAEQDIMDYTRQATAFTLLKAILKRKLIEPQVDEVMRKVANMSVECETDHIRLQCRQVFCQYMFDYPIGKKMKNHIGFFVSHLFYELEYGRKSALEMLQTIVTSFPINQLKKFYKHMFIPISTCLVNDDSPICRKMAANVLISLMKNLDYADQDYLFNVVMEWLHDSKARHRVLAAQLCGVFSDFEKENFRKRIGKFLPVFINQLDPEKHEFTDEDIAARTSDHLIFHILNTIMKIVNECNLLQCEDWQDEMCLLWEYVQQHLAHPHNLVRLASCQLVGLLFCHYPVEKLVDAIVNPKESPHYLLTDTITKMQKFTFNLITQMQSRELDTNLQDQVIKNLAFVAKFSRALEVKRMEKMDLNDDETEDKKLQLNWLIGKMIRECKFELAHAPGETSKRSCIFKWLAAVATSLGREGLNKERLTLILSPLQREINDKSVQADEELKSLALEVVELIKPQVEHGLFAKCFADLQISTSKKRLERKAERAREVVNNPEIAVRKRIKKQKSKIDSKRRKIERLRPTAIKRKKLKNLVIVS